MFTIEGRCYLGERILKARVGLIWLWVLVCVLITAADPLARLPWLAIASALFVLAHYPGDQIALLAALSAYLPPLLDEVRSTGPSLLVPAAAFVGLAILSWLALVT